jgi:uncharacterized Zn-finger protein
MKNHAKLEKFMKRATQKDIQYIRIVYLRCKSIAKTSEITGWSTSTVHKYVKDLSCEHPSSKYNHRKVLKLNKDTKKIISKYNDLTMAAEKTKISISNIDHCLKHNTNTAGGYIWIYEDEYDL